MLHSQQFRESRSIWGVEDTMPTVTEIANPSVHGSQIAPRFSPDNRQTQQYKQAWIVEGPHDSDVKSTTK